MPLYTKKYIPLCISPYTGQIQLVMDNKSHIPVASLGDGEK